MNEQSTGVTSTEQTSFIDSLRQAPAGTEGDVALFHVFWNYAALFVAAIHVSWVLLFWLRDVPPLAYLNIISVGMWLSAFWLNRMPHTSLRFHIILSLILGEVTGHALAAVWYIGIDTGFQNYILAALIGAVFFPKAVYGIHLLYALFALAFYGGLRYLGEGHVAQFKLTPQELGFYALFNQVSFVLVLGVIIFVYRMTSDRLRETIESLNTQIKEQVLVRYLPPALINDIFEGKVSMDTKPATQDITVLFSDLSGFTKMSEEQGAETVAEFLNDYLTVMNETIFQNHGTIDKFIGDAIMVLFGAPVSMSSAEQAQNATRCAQAMQAGMAEVNAKWQSKGIAEVSMRIGIHQGKAVVGNFGSPQRVDYTAVGPSTSPRESSPPAYQAKSSSRLRSASS